MTPGFNINLKNYEKIGYYSKILMLRYQTSSP